MGEPFLRYYKEHGVKLVPDMSIFFTRNTFDCMNGVQNLITSLYGSETSIGTKLYGPRHFVSLINKFRCPYTRFTPCSFCDLSTQENILGIKNIAGVKKVKKTFPSEFNEAYYRPEGWNQFVKEHFKDDLINNACSEFYKEN